MFCLGPPRRLAPLLAIGALVLAGCGTTTEKGSETFIREHSAEAGQAAGAVRAVTADVDGLSARPSAAALAAVVLAQHRTRRDLLAASKWTVSENGEEEGVSQAEKELNEATGALLQAMTDIRIYAEDRRPVALVHYRKELALGREYWDQGITQLWFVAHRAGAPKI